MSPTAKHHEPTINYASRVRVSSLLCLSFFIGWLVSMTIDIPNNPLALSLSNAAHFPFDYSTHLDLSHIYVDTMRLEMAKNELYVSKAQTPNVLGESDSNKLDREISLLPQKVGSALEFWKNVTSEYPEYSAGLIQQIYYYYNSGDFINARRHANTLKFLDGRNFEKLPAELKE